MFNYLQRLELSSIWALLAAFEDPLPIPPNAITFPFEGAFVRGVDSLSWMANNTKKLSCSPDTGPHCWTFFSTAAFGKRNKVPQVSVTEILFSGKPGAHMRTTYTWRGLDHQIMPFGIFWLATFLVKWLPTCLSRAEIYKFIQIWYVRKYLDLLVGSYKWFHCALTGEYSSSHSR